MSIGEHHGGPGLVDRRFEGRLAFQQMVRDALDCAAQEGWREIILCDPDFEDWPLNESDVAQSLHAWSRRGRRITLLAHRWNSVPRVHARFVEWRKRWSDIVEARGCRQADPNEFPSAIWTPGWMMQRHDLPRCIGTSSSEPARVHLLHEQLQEWLGKSSSAFPATTLGL